MISVNCSVRFHKKIWAEMSDTIYSPLWGWILNKTWPCTGLEIILCGWGLSSGFFSRKIVAYIGIQPGTRASSSLLHQLCYLAVATFNAGSRLCVNVHSFARCATLWFSWASYSTMRSCDLSARKGFYHMRRGMSTDSEGFTTFRTGQGPEWDRCTDSSIS